MTKRPTRAGTRKLSEVARHIVKPSGIVATGWPKVEKTAREKLGIAFDEWQCGAGRLTLARRADGKLAAMVGGVGMSLPRQVGKTYLLAGLLFALCVDNPGLLVIWSAHHSKTHNETFLAMQGFAKRLKVAPYVEQVYTGSGDEAVVFVNGSRILFGARERGFGRGIPGVDVLVMDEAQILSDKALENMLATLNTSQLGLALYIGTPPRPEDNSEAFTRIRTEALSGDSDDLVWIECGADPDADPHDEKQWAMANPSFPHRTPRESILRLLRRLKEDGFRHEGLGIWDEVGAGILPGWSGLFLDVDDDEFEWELPQPSAVGIAVGIGGSHGSIASADAWPDGVLIGEPSIDTLDGPTDSQTDLTGAVNLSAVDRRSGTDWIPAEAKRIQDLYGCDVVIDEKCPDGTLIERLEQAGVYVTVMALTDVVQGCSELVNRVREGRVTHQRTTELDDAIEVAIWRSVGDGRQVFGRQKSSGPIDMLEAATAALWGALNPQTPAIY
jgi:hypothetical protein